MRSAAEVEADLTGPGGDFEITVEEVLGESVQVFKNRYRSLREILERSVEYGSNEYIICEEQRITFSEHLLRVKAVAHQLRNTYGVQPGDRVAILADNHPQWIISFWATVSIGGICVGLNGWWNREEIKYGLEDADPAVLIGDRKRLARIEDLDLPFPVICIEDNFESLEEGWDETNAPVLPECRIVEDDPALILYTSGTTGRSKGAMLTHRCLVTLLMSATFSGARMRIMEAEAGTMLAANSLPSCGLFSAPLFHVSGLITGVLSSLSAGVKAVWTLGRFDPEKILRLIEAERVTLWPSMGSMAARVLDHPDFDKYDVSSVNRLGTGGAPISEALQRRMTRSFKNTEDRMSLGYGLTESSGVGTHNWGDLLAEHPNSVGRVFPTMEISIRGEDGQPLPVGQQGEIWMRGSCIMLGYWRNPDATNEAIAPGRWLRTGDIGHFEGEFLYINTRARDLILRNAENVYPVEVEHCLELFPETVEAAVIGVPHAEMGQEVKAIVVMAEGVQLDTEALQAFCSERLAEFKVPSQWEVRSEPLPRNAAGKILRNVLSGEADLKLTEE
jgi:acyl-CoA synthetase (AMP-forming)/AMP-acid ligase II